MAEEWGPWIEHDGTGCPCVGKVVGIEFGDGEQKIGVAGAGCAKHGVDPNSRFSCWVWEKATPGPDDIIRYRIRKPKALRELIDLVENLPVNVKETA